MRDSSKLLPVAKPWLGEAEAEAARRAILTGWVTQGPEVAAFEQEFAACVGSRHAGAVSSCTTALHLALLAVGVSAGDEVITVSHSFIATANAVRYCGARPVFVDIEGGDSATYNIDPDRIEEVITPRTRAILCVHQMGMPCDVARIVEIGRRLNIPIVEDAACAIGSEILWRGEWQKIGRPHGDVACFSFHPRKVVTTGDGGMITTADPEIDRRVRRLRQHGMSIPDTVRHGSPQVLFESYDELGFNYRMTDIQAAIGREQLKRLPEMIEQRCALAARYRTLLAELPRLILPREPEWARSNWQSFCIGLPVGRNQRAVMQSLLDEGIATRRGIMCAHREPAYRPRSSLAARGCGDSLLNSERAQDRTIVLPLFHEMTEADQDRVVSALSIELLRDGGIGSGLKAA